MRLYVIFKDQEVLQNKARISKLEQKETKYISFIDYSFYSLQHAFRLFACNSVKLFREKVINGQFFLHMEALMPQIQIKLITTDLLLKAEMQLLLQIKSIFMTV